MSKVSLTLGETKSEVSLTAEGKDTSMRWDDADMTWDDATFTWDNPRRPLTKETKSKVSLTNETK